jgi:hypothetical protein
MTTEMKRRGNPNWGYVKPYQEAREEIKSMGFKTMSEYKEWVMENQPEGFSINPYQIYRYRGEWISTAHYLGKEDSETPEIIEQYDVQVHTGFFTNLKDSLKNILHLRLRKHSYSN